MPEWTPSQKDAIEARGGTVLVSAAAGSGKTAVLVERVIQIILDEKKPVDVDSLLIVTFTNAAAAEMRERISRTLSEQLFAHPGNQHIMRQQMLLPGAKICTIDAFCKDLVQENFHKLNIAQNFRILDESELKVLEADSASSVLEKFYENNDRDFLSLVELLSSSRNDDTLSYYIVKLYTYIMAHPFPEQWLRRMEEMYTETSTIDATQWSSLIMEHSRNTILFLIEQLENCFHQLEQAADTVLLEKISPVLESDCTYLNSLLQLNEWNAVLEQLCNAKFVRFPAIRGYTEHPVKNHVAAVRKDVKKNIDLLSALFCATAEEHEADMEQLAPVVSTLAKLVNAFQDDLNKRKTSENSLSFSDIEHFALKLLVHEKGHSYERTNLAKELQNKYAYILIDEYQDTNRAQDMLFEALSNGDNLFMVGDVKQSIYRFRQAMPQIFMEKKKLFAQYDGKHYPAKIVLDKNFRSHPDICSFINFVFSLLFSEEVGELQYSADEFLNAGASFPDKNTPALSFHVLRGDDIPAADTDAYEAEYLAQIIKDKVDNGFLIHDKGNERPIKFGDFAILFRSASSHIPNYAEVFRQHGIPVSSEAGADFFERPEITTMLSFLRVIDNPMQDVPLLSIMMSPIFGFLPDELAEMKIADRKSSFYTCVMQYYKIGKGNEKLERFFKMTERLRTYSVTMPTSVFIRKLYDETSYVAIAKSMGEPEQREGNLNLLLDYAAYFEDSGRRGLSSFIRFLDRMCENKQQFKSANLRNSENAVKLMSIHRSKGLEFPFCILAGTSRKYNNIELRDSLLLHPELGVGLKVHNEELLYQYNTVPYNAVRLAINNAEMSENLRVLYVAMTRAKENLCIVATERNLKRKINKLAYGAALGKLSPYTVSCSNSDAELLFYCVLLHSDGQILRELADIPVPVKKSNFSLDVKVVENIIKKEVSVEDIEKAAVEESIVAAISERLSYQYPYYKLSGIAAKRNASDLDDDEKGASYFAASRPAFLSEGGLTSAQKGTAMHAFMQHCNYDYARENICAEANRMEKLGFLTPEERHALDTAKLREFFQGAFAKRIFSAEKVMREIKFADFLKGNAIYPELKEAENEKIYVQGIADCAFVENGQMVVVDYKTDRVKDGEELLGRYEKQLRFYCKALEKTYEIPVKECYLYSFYLNKALQYDFL